MTEPNSDPSPIRRSEAASSFSSLLDFSFNSFITVSIIKILYILGIIANVIVGLSVIVSGFSQGFGPGVLSLILAPIVVVLGIIFTRIYLELIVVIFRIANNTSIMAQASENRTAPPPSPSV